jgi:hypothetical protein
MDRIYLNQDGSHWRALVNAVVRLQVAKDAGKFSDSRTNSDLRDGLNIT